ncbi:glycoside hydrolase [Hortaea werneckii]|nr:glycoside hydrolase [Hortaea werneckii]
MAFARRWKFRIVVVDCRSRLSIQGGEMGFMSGEKEFVWVHKLIGDGFGNCHVLKSCTKVAKSVCPSTASAATPRISSYLDVGCRTSNRSIASTCPRLVIPRTWHPNREVVHLDQRNVQAANVAEGRATAAHEMIAAGREVDRCLTFWAELVVLAPLHTMESCRPSPQDMQLLTDESTTFLAVCAIGAGSRLTASSCIRRLLEKSWHRKQVSRSCRANARRTEKATRSHAGIHVFLKSADSYPTRAQNLEFATPDVGSPLDSRARKEVELHELFSGIQWQYCTSSSFRVSSNRIYTGPLPRFLFLRRDLDFSSSSLLSSSSSSLSSSLPIAARLPPAAAAASSSSSSSSHASSSASMCSCQTFKIWPPPEIIRLPTSKPSSTTPSISSCCTSPTTLFCPSLMKRTLPSPRPTATFLPKPPTPRGTSANASIRDHAVAASNQCFLASGSRALLGRQSRNSVRANVVPPVVSHCLLKPDVDVEEGGSAVSEEMSSACFASLTGSVGAGSRRSYRCNAPASVPRRSVCGLRAWMTVGPSILFGLDVSALPPGIASLPVTLPVSLSAALTMPSVPAEYSCRPSMLYDRQRQLPLCLLVLHAVSTTPSPLLPRLCFKIPSPFDRLAFSSSSPTGGSFSEATCPLLRPTATSGSQQLGVPVPTLAVLAVALSLCPSPPDSQIMHAGASNVPNLRQLCMVAAVPAVVTFNRGHPIVGQWTSSSKARGSVLLSVLLLSCSIALSCPKPQPGFVSRTSISLREFLMVLKRKPQKGITFGYCDINTGQRVYPPPPVSEMTDLLPEQQPPEQQKPAFYPEELDQDDMYVKVTCHPPLGQATRIARHQHSVKFAVLLETSNPSLVDQEASANTDEQPQVCLWHNHNGHFDWSELPLTPTREYSDVLLVNRPRDRRLTRTWFTTELPGLPKHAHVVSFTVKFRVATSKGWKWVKDTSGCKPLRDPILASSTIVSAKRSPVHAGNKFELDKDGVLLSFLRSDGMHVVCLGISGVDDVMTTFLHDSEGNVIVKSRNDRAETGTCRVLVAVADSFEVANAAVMYHARKIVGTLSSTAATDDKTIGALTDEKVKPEWLEEWYDGLTYCTWNGLGQALTADKIHTALDSLSSNNINITNLIIDDNWQSLSQGDTQFKRAWQDFEATPDGFPMGMKAFTSEVRKRHPNVNHIAVWHAILGYWGGVDPNGKIGQKYKTVEVEKEPGVAGGKFHIVAAEDAKQMYDDFYRFLSESGVNSVKTDAQFFLDLLLHAPDRRAVTTEYQDAWTLAHLRHFSSRAISCMSQAPQILFHSQLPTNKPRLLVRNSDDFFPEVAASHPWHIFCNAHNALFTQHLNVLPDWDMFQTSHPWAGFHAAARAGRQSFSDRTESDERLMRIMVTIIRLC